MTAAAAIDVAPEADCGLRERKKRETRKSIHRSALELAFEAGLEALTVDAIAGGGSAARDGAGCGPLPRRRPRGGSAAMGYAPGVDAS